MSDDIYRPPPQPFYAETANKKRRRPVITNYRKEYFERKRRELAEELAKPIEQRVGKLKSMANGDFTPEELAEIVRKVGKKK